MDHKRAVRSLRAVLLTASVLTATPVLAQEQSTEARLDRLVSEQARILDFAAPLLAPGGLLVYATCALTDREGRDQVDAFLARQAGWRAEPIEAGVDQSIMGRAHGHGLLLTPGHDGTDGFYFARLRRTA
jgi:16S rRNA (cytosine967-C5)-methyltransferase